MTDRVDVGSNGFGEALQFTGPEQSDDKSVVQRNQPIGLRWRGSVDWAEAARLYFDES
ncbi:hypothetical protein V5E97_33865 [Singulisphaera sp. Ch08]|uniref:Uncharacterized protein n=1 Tax=Singulisphaera sp. Ch08 TaxID=3120278 RepID=A0AAU7CDS3_9BACT